MMIDDTVRLVYVCLPNQSWYGQEAGLDKTKNCSTKISFTAKLGITYQCFEIRTFHLARYFSWKAHEPLNQNKEIQKSDMGLWVTVTYACSVDCLSCNLNHMKLPFPDVFDKLLSLYTSSFPPKSVSSSHNQTNTHHVRVLNLLNQISLK